MLCYVIYYYGVEIIYKVEELMKFIILDDIN